MTKKIMPKGPCCTDLHVFDESSVCSDLYEEVVREPKCLKYDVKLGWDTSGRILKCSECLAEVKASETV